MAIVAIVGRPNVGKSALFNRILGRRKAIVEDVAGVTRDRIYGATEWDGREFMIVDTAGLDPIAEDGLFALIRRQALAAIEEADLIVFVVDVRSGPVPADLEVAQILRRTNKPVVVAVNKSEGEGREREALAFSQFGMEPVCPVSALHGQGVAELLDEVAARLPEGPKDAPDGSYDVRVAVLGRPNMGKSTLINRILGEERLVVSEVPGTTQDSVDTLVRRGERKYLLVDTAGIRRRSRVQANLERYSVMRSLAALERSDVCLLILDASNGIVDQDVRIGGMVEEAGKGLVIVLNKWDLVAKDHKTFDERVRDLRESLFFFKHAPVISLSGLTGQRVDRVFDAVESVWSEANRQVPTAQLNRVIGEAIERHQPVVLRGQRIKFFYAVQSGRRPPAFTLFSSRPGQIRENYVRYLENYIRDAFGFAGTPIRLRFKRGRKE